MGIGGSKIEEKPVQSTTTDTRISTDLSIANKEELTDWHVNIQNLLDHAIEQHNNATAKAGPQSPNKQKKKKKRKDTEKVEEAPEPSEPPPSRIDDGIRSLSIQYSLAPKEANQIKRSIALTTKLERITYKNHFGGPGVGYREEIASRVLLAVGKWFGESTSLTSIDLSNNNIGGSTRGIDKRTGDVLCPVYDIRKVGPNGSYIIQGLADSKLKRYELQYGSHETKEGNGAPSNTSWEPPRQPPRQVNKVKPMGRIVLKHNNVTHYGYYYRKVGVALRNLFANPGRIISLDLSHCSIGCDAMAKGFSNGCCGIEKINLTNNQLGGRWRHDGKWESSVSFVKELKNILLNDQTQSKYKGIFPPLAKTIPLRSINLSSNRLNTSHCIVLAKGLSENNTLKNINFSHNNKLCDDGVEAIVNSQYSTQSILEMLDLRETGMTNMSVFALKKLHSKLEKKSLPAAKVFAFEISDRGRSVLQNNAQLNECSSAIAVGDEATYEALANIISMHQSALVLIDIEGDEYQLLDSEMLSLLSSSTVIVELHPRKVADGWHLQQKLMQDAAKFFETEILVRETYNPNMFEELSEFSDEDRLLAFSEGRKAVGLWLILTPKAHSAKDYCNEHNC
jgi:hypothetical protein